MTLERKKSLQVFRDANEAWGSYDDYPVGPAGTDPMPHLSRNRVPQPFFLVSDEDHVLVQMSGEGTLELRETGVNTMRLSPGDTVYVPAGVPTRIVPDRECIQLRLKSEPRGREAAAWYCRVCGELVHAAELSGPIAQEAYLAATSAFNVSEALRRCAQCGEVHPPVDLGDIAWAEVAAALRQEREEQG